jgi:RNA polymerase sigma-70 factor, ECF subfamily
VKTSLAAVTGAGLHHASDADLLAAAARKDAEAFGLLVSRHQGLVYRVVWRLTKGHAESEDIAQEAFLRLWNNPAQVKEAAALKGWLARVASNLVMDWFRKRTNTVTEDVSDVGDARPNAEDRLQQNWVGVRINAAIAGLPERQRLALSLIHFEQFAQADAAAAMELSIDAFESLLARARRGLKDQLSNDRHDLMAAVTQEG